MGPIRDDYNEIMIRNIQYNISKSNSKIKKSVDNLILKEHPIKLWKKKEFVYLNNINPNKITPKDFKDLENDQIQKIFHFYHETFKFRPNFSTRLTKKFLSWISKNYSLYYTNLCKKINDNMQILNFIIFMSYHTDTFIRNITRSLYVKGIHINEEVIRKYVKILLGDNYDKRKEKSLVKSGRIMKFNDDYINRLNNNVKKIVLRLPLIKSKKKEIIQYTLNLSNHVFEQGLSPNDLGLHKNSTSLSIILIYYSFVSLGIKKINKEKMSISSIYKYLKNNFEEIRLAETSFSNMYPSKLIPFLPKEIYNKVKDKTHPHQLDYQEIKNFIESLDLILITNETQFYSNKIKDNTSPSQTEIIIKCPNNHKWKTTYGNVYSKKRCGVCNRPMMKSFDDIKDFIELKGGKLLTSKKEYNDLRKYKITIPTKTKVDVKCKNGHIWKTTYDRIKSNHWCPECKGLKSLDYKIIKRFIESKGGILNTSREQFETLRTSESTRPSITRLNVQCQKGHIWSTTYDRLNNQKSWCPKCADGKYEKICRWYLNKILSYITSERIEFIKVQIKNVMKLPTNIPKKFSEISFEKMHFDGFSTIHINRKVFKIAFEYNGPQHYIFPNHIYKDTSKGKKRFLRQQLVDEFKKWLAKEVDLVYIIFPYYIDKEMQHPFKIQNYLKKEISSKIKLDLRNIPQFDHFNRDFYKFITDF